MPVQVLTPAYSPDGTFGNMHKILTYLYSTVLILLDLVNKILSKAVVCRVQHGRTNIPNTDDNFILPAQSAL